MRNFMNNFKEPIHHTGLYRVSVPAREGNRERLVSIWIDPAMRRPSRNPEAKAPGR